MHFLKMICVQEDYINDMQVQVKSKSALGSKTQTLTCCMNSLTPWMKAGTPDVVTVMEGAPPGPTPAPPSREPRSWLRSGGISWDCGSPAVVSDWPGWLEGFAVGGVGPELEKEKEEEAEEV